MISKIFGFGKKPGTGDGEESKKSVLEESKTSPEEPAVSYRQRDFRFVRKDTVKISIIYNYFSKGSTIFKSLESLQNQSLSLCAPEEVEIILIDDGTEGEDVVKKLPPDVKYLWQRKIGYGICRAKNTGAKVSDGKYLVFLDPDILVSNNYIDTILKGFRRYGDRVVQCGYIWDYHFVGCPDPRTEFGVWENPSGLSSRFYQVAGGNMAISRNLFMETGGFDEDLIYGGVEDLLFGYTLSQLPATALYFNREMEGRHIPHPPSPAHADPGKSWEIVKIKYPEFYDDYMVRKLR